VSKTRRTAPTFVAWGVNDSQGKTPECMRPDAGVSARLAVAARAIDIKPAPSPAVARRRFIVVDVSFIETTPFLSASS